ncbi:MAG TPA: GNAT family N-acetyltransferase [Polyangiaceae bacterium]|nr:GNAT family N-acetyltransferase [Polyangiaceae bacterium]
MAELNRELIVDEGHSNSMTKGELELRMRGWLSHEYRAVLFTEQGVVVAYAVFRDDGSRGVYVRQIFVVRERRRQGLGRCALRLLEDEALPKDRRIVVDVLSGNSVGRAFWSACGFDEYAVMLERLPAGARSE